MNIQKAKPTLILLVILFLTATCGENEDPVPEEPLIENPKTEKGNENYINEFEFSSVEIILRAILKINKTENDVVVQYGKVNITVPYGTNVTALSPIITISEKATITPASEVTQDFTKPLTYKVMAEDGTVREYVVTVKVAVK